MKLKKHTPWIPTLRALELERGDLEYLMLVRNCTASQLNAIPIQAYQNSLDLAAATANGIIWNLLKTGEKDGN